MKNYVSGNGKDNVSVILKTLKPEERQVVRMLDSHGGIYMQKLITRDSGLTRLRTHRVIGVLAERGIVHVEKGEIPIKSLLQEWFHDGMRQFCQSNNIIL